MTPQPSLPAGLSITYIGHATVLFTTPKGARVLIDPFVSNNPKSPIKNEEVGKLDAILVTHGHLDHIADVLPIAQATGAKVVANPEIAHYFVSKGLPQGQAVEMNKGGTVHLDDLGFSVTMVNAFHSSGIEDGSGAPPVYGGEAAGYMVHVHTAADAEPYVFYHAGDTAVFGDMNLLADIYQPRLAFLPIGDHYTMGPREAAVASGLLASVEYVVPIHYGTFPILTGTPDAFRDALNHVEATVQVCEMAPGDTVGG
jgi:L-ascorbate metabolism protein UlaG (beta-lactamase superfamily)